MAVVADSRGIRQRGGVRDCGQLDAGSPSTTPTRLGFGGSASALRCRVLGADAARRSGLAGRMVDRGGVAAVLGAGAWAMRGDPIQVPFPQAPRHQHGVRTAGSQCCSSATRSRESDTSSRAHSCRGDQTEFVRLAGQRRLARRRVGRCPVGGTVGVAVRALVASDPARGSAAFAGVRNRTARPGSGGRRGPHRSSPVRGHLHRGQHDGPGSRTPARIPRRRGVAD